jgi:uncharacterized iron-regulated protein
VRRGSSFPRRTALLAVLLCCAAALPLAAQAVSGYVPHRVYDVRAGRWTDFETMAAALAAADVAFVGEQHDDPGTHRLQLALMEGLARRRGGVVLALEMFERDVQPLLDRYLAGDVPEDAFLAGSRPWPNYAEDYRPLVEFARARGWPVVAGNVPRRIAAGISRAGPDTLAALPAEERALAAAELRCPRDAYFARFAEQMRAHPLPGTAAEQTAMTERFYAAQCAKDETMAESVTAALERHGPGTLVVHLNGAFHTDRRMGIVPRLARRAPRARAVVVSALPVADLDRVDPREHRRLGEYLLFTLRSGPER